MTTAFRLAVIAATWPLWLAAGVFLATRGLWRLPWDESIAADDPRWGRT